MTGSTEETETHRSTASAPQASMPHQRPVRPAVATAQAMTRPDPAPQPEPEQDRVEIPAFLRRQAN